jgi:transposase
VHPVRQPTAPGTGNLSVLPGHRRDQKDLRTGLHPYDAYPGQLRQHVLQRNITHHQPAAEPARPSPEHENDQRPRKSWKVRLLDTPHLLREIRELGYTGSANLLVRYLNQGRAEGDRPVTTPRHAGRLLLTDPENLRPKETTLLEKTAAACPEMTALADLVRGFATLLKPAEGNDVKLTEWIAAAMPHLRSFTNGLEIDRAAVDAGLTLPHHNGRTEGVSTRTKRIRRQMHKRAGFDLLRHRILLP